MPEFRDVSPDAFGPLWPLVQQVAREVDAAKWVLVGGIMVHTHCWIAGRASSRPTIDLDMLVDVLADADSVMLVATRLRGLGFGLTEPGWKGSPAHRFKRGMDVVDVLVADHLPKHVQPRLGRYPVMPIDGGAQALDRVLHLRVEATDGPVSLRVPNLLGALVLKAAAAAVDSRDRERHLRDALILASMIADPLSVRAQMRGSDRRRLTRLLSQLSHAQMKRSVFPETVKLDDALGVLEFLITRAAPGFDKHANHHR
jgi:hypothetical protein